MIFGLLALASVAVTIPAAERIAIFKAAGHLPTAGRYLKCNRQQPLELETRDVNGDGRLDALVIDGGLECYGNTETGFTLLTRSPNGRWTKLHQSPGVPTFLPTRANSWPELEIGGPGFCFPVYRWTGKTFALARHAYEGKTCRPN